MLKIIRRIARSLSAQLILAFVVAIAATTIIAGLPSYWSLRAELEHQAWERVSDGVRVSQALIEAEKNGLNNLANHTAQRPTLQRLIQENNQEALYSYLQDFQAGVDLDFIIISDGFGKPVVATLPISLPLEITKPRSTGFYAFTDNKPKLGFVATQTIPVESNEDTVFVTVGVFIDDGFAAQMAAESGFEQSFLIADLQIASSLAGVPADRPVYSQTTLSQDHFDTITFDGSRVLLLMILLFSYLFLYK